MLPKIVQHAKVSFRSLDHAAKDDAVAEVVANAYVVFVRLVKQNKAELAYASVLARYGVARFCAGRRTGNRLNARDVLSKYAEQRKRIKVSSLDRYDDEEEQWFEAKVQDTRSSPVPDAVSFRLDFAAWLRRLSRRNRRIAKSLMIGNRTRDVSRQFKVSEDRIAQLRRELAKSWAVFRGEEGSSARIDPAAALKATHAVGTRRTSPITGLCTQIVA
jgi:hypothetical protein